MNIEKLNQIKKDYEKIQMSERGYQKMIHSIKKAKEEKDYMRKKKFYKGFAVAAASVAVMVTLPNISSNMATAMGNIPVVGGVFKVLSFRDYHYEDDKKYADVSVPEVEVTEKVEGEKKNQAESASRQINEEIKKLSNQWIKKFKQDAKQDGYKEMKVSSEVVYTTKDYFTLKLTCNQTEASGYEENHYFTINLNTGERVQLEDVFVDGSDYKRVIRDNIKNQMKEQMNENQEIVYWLDDEEIPEEDNFKEISDNEEFYLDEKGQVVICFAEGEVAPMYMGAVSFTIPAEVTTSIMK